MSKYEKGTVIKVVIAAMALAAIAFYSYKRDQEARNNGVYTVASIYKKRIAKNGWKVNVMLDYRDSTYTYSTMIDWEHLSLDDTLKRFYVKILDYAPSDGIFLIPRRIANPDSIVTSPPEGWTEEWMKAHYPKVVEYVHDTR